MRIGIDARMIDNTGIGRYLRNLLVHLAQVDRENEYLVFVNHENTRVVTQENVKFVTLRQPVPVYSLREQFRLPLQLRPWRLDLMHYPNFAIPLVQTCPYVVTIHDVIYYLYPEQCPSIIAHYYARWMLRYATTHARMIITDSYHSQQDLMRHFHIPAHCIQVIYPAADTLCSPEKSSETEPLLKSRYGIRQPYMLFVGKHHPYKNIKTLLQAYMSRPEIYQQAQLVIAGKRDQRRSDLYELAEKCPQRGQIIFTDFVQEDVLFELYRHARLFVFPSLYEGFGLPPLEAMACGVPVICSNAASLPEVVGDAAIQVDPRNSNELAEAMQFVLTNEDQWQRLRQKGLQRAQHFSWKIAARQLLNIYTQQGNTSL